MWRVAPLECLQLLATAGAIMWLDVQNGLFVGIGLSIGEGGGEKRCGGCGCGTRGSVPPPLHVTRSLRPRARLPAATARARAPAPHGRLCRARALPCGAARRPRHPHLPRRRPGLLRERPRCVVRRRARGGKEGRQLCGGARRNTPLVSPRAASPPCSPHPTPAASSSGSSCRTSAPPKRPVRLLLAPQRLLQQQLGVRRVPARGAPAPHSSLSPARWRGARLRRQCRRRPRLRAMLRALWVATRPLPPQMTQRTTVYPRGAAPSSEPSGRSRRTRSLRPCGGALAAQRCWRRPSPRCLPGGRRRAIGGETGAAAAHRQEPLLRREGG